MSLNNMTPERFSVMAKMRDGEKLTEHEQEIADEMEDEDKASNDELMAAESEIEEFDNKMNIEDNDEIMLIGQRHSWKNFFDVIANRKDPILRKDGGSTGNFWAFIQSLERQFHENDGEMCSDCYHRKSDHILTYTGNPVEGESRSACLIHGCDCMRFAP